MKRTPFFGYEKRGFYMIKLSYKAKISLYNKTMIINYLHQKEYNT